LPFDSQAVLAHAGKHDRSAILLAGVDFTLEVLCQSTLDLAPGRWRPLFSLHFSDVNSTPTWSCHFFADDLVTEKLGVADQQFQLIRTTDEIVKPRKRRSQFSSAIDCRQVRLPALRALPQLRVKVDLPDSPDDDFHPAQVATSRTANIAADFPYAATEG
jgi:hypothetical protein